MALPLTSYATVRSSGSASGNVSVMTPEVPLPAMTRETVALAVTTGSGAGVVLCRLQGWEAVVEVAVDVRLSLLGAVTAHGRARAGPVDERQPSTIQ